MTGRRLALPLTLLVFAVYLALLPWTGQVWLRTGDEPHYLVAADSLVRDGDFDLRNNYDPSVFLDWYPSPNLEPQVKTRADGAQFLIHTYGLSVLIAPAYWLAGARGVAYFMALLGALLAGQVYLLAFQVTSDWRASALGALVVALAPPLVWYVYLLYPELAGALCVTVAVRMLLDQKLFSPLPLREGGPGGLGRTDATASSQPLYLTPALPHMGRERSVSLPLPLAGEGGRGDDVSPVATRSGEGERPLLAPLRNTEGYFGLLLFGLSLAALPWLSARFIPAALTLAALFVLRLAWLNWGARLRTFLVSPFVLPPLFLTLSLAGLAWFNAVHYGSAGVAASYTSDVNPGPISAGMLLQFTRGTLGWLLDHQRGLLIAGPIYFVAFVGLGQWLWHRQWAAVVIGLPFAAALGATALIGGFWVGIEPGARYLVYVLPPLGAAIAYAWVHRRGPWLAGLTALTLAASLWTAVQVLRNPLLAQTHDLIGEQVPALVSYLPALGKPTFLSPGASGELAVPAADPPSQPALWRVPKGQPGSALQQPAITDLPFGWYTLQFALGAQGAPADAPVARVLFQSGDHQPILDRMLYGRDFAPDGQMRSFQFPVFNGIYNQWEQPAGLWIFTTGQAELTLSAVTLPPDPFHSLVVPGLWLAGLIGLGLLVGTRFTPAPEAPAALALPAWLNGWAPALACAALALGVGLWSLRPLPRQYPVADLANFIGSRVPDPAAAGGQAISTLGDEDTPGALAVTRPEFWSAGRYTWRVSLKAPDSATRASASPAQLIIHAPRQSVAGFPADLIAGAVPADGRFHTLEVQFQNPLRQALVFELDATGAAPLETQGFEVDPQP